MPGGKPADAVPRWDHRASWRAGRRNSVFGLCGGRAGAAVPAAQGSTSVEAFLEGAVVQVQAVGVDVDANEEAPQKSAEADFRQPRALPLKRSRDVPI